MVNILLARGTTDTLEYQKMLINVFVDKIYLYDDHFTIFFNNSKKGANTGKKEVETIEKYFSEPSSESTSCCVPNITKTQPIGWGLLCFGTVHRQGFEPERAGALSRALR